MYSNAQSGLRPADERLHPPFKDQERSESYTWSFFAESGFWGQATLVFQHHWQRIDRFVFLVTPDHKVWVTVDVDTRSPLDLRALSKKGFRCVKPFAKWHIQMQRNLFPVPRGQDLSLYFWARQTSWERSVSVMRESAGMSRQAKMKPVPPPDLLPVTLDLRYISRSAAQRVDWSFLGDLEHYQESGSLKGSVRIGEEVFLLQGSATRDHTWGVQDWLRPQSWYAGACQIGDLSVQWVSARTVDGRQIQGGFVHHPERGSVAVRSLEILDVKHASGHDQHVEAAHIELRLADGETCDIFAEARSFCHFSVHQEGDLACHSSESLCHFCCNDQSGLGILEHGQQIELSKPGV